MPATGWGRGTAVAKGNSGASVWRVLDKHDALLGYAIGMGKANALRVAKANEPRTKAVEWAKKRLYAEYENNKGELPSWRF